MGRKILLPYDEELLRLLNFTIYNTDNFEIRKTTNSVRYKIYKSYEVDKGYNLAESKLTISDIESNETNYKNHSGFETITMVVRRKTEKKEDKSEERGDGYYPYTEGFRNESMISFSKHINQYPLYNKNRPCIHSEDIKIDLIYTWPWTKKETDVELLTLENLRKKPVIQFNQNQEIIIPKKLGNEYIKKRGTTTPSLEIIYNETYSGRGDYIFKDGKIVDTYGKSYTYRINDSTILERLKDDEGLILPLLEFILSNPDYIKKYEYTKNFSKEYPHLNYEDARRVLEVIDMRNFLLGELNSGIGFTQEQMQYLITSINEKAPIDKISDNNVFIKKR